MKGKHFKGKIIKVGKTNGKFKFTCWVKDENNSVQVVDFLNDVDNWHKIARNVTFSEMPSEETNTSKNFKEDEAVGVFYLKNKHVEQSPADIYNADTPRN